MKSVMISTKPYWVFCMIVKSFQKDYPSEKRIEVRKNYPKDCDWNKRIIIYCTKDRKSFEQIPKKYQSLMRPLMGKIVGEFVCDYIRREPGIAVGLCDVVLEKESCVEHKELIRYAHGKPLYAWYIFNIKTYDKPKELGEFRSICKEWSYNTARCGKCEYYYFEDNESYREEGCACEGMKPMKRPPQSWCYVCD